MAMGVLVERLEEDERAARERVRRDVRRVRRQASGGKLVQGDVRVSRVLATYNIKGGVGKTSAAVNLAYLASRDGARTLLWDLDPQGASTYLFRVKAKVRGGGRKLVRLKSDPARLIKGTDHEGLDLLPADFSYRHMDLVLKRFKRPTRRLARVLEPLSGEYDYVFLDCPPSISLVSESVFEAADALLVPVIPATLSSRTLGQLEELVNGGRGGPQVLAFFSMVDARKRLHREVMEQLRAEHSERAAGGDPDRPPRSSGWGSSARCWRRSRRAGARPRAYEALWGDVRERLGANTLRARSDRDRPRYPMRPPSGPPPTRPTPPRSAACCCCTAAASTRA